MGEMMELENCACDIGRLELKVTRGFKVVCDNSSYIGRLELKVPLAG